MAKKKLSHGGKKILTSPEAVKEVLSKTAKGRVSALAKEAENVLKDFTATNLYEAYDPKKYNRTNDLIRSITKTKSKKVYGDRYTATVYFDSSKIKAIPPTSSEWGKHTDFKGNSRVKEVIGWMEEGTSPLYSSKGNLIYEGHEPAHMIEDTRKYIQSKIGDIVIKDKIYRPSESDGYDSVVAGIRIYQK